jgi:uncharacterized repeat protein (TIGR03847 family)
VSDDLGAVFLVALAVGEPGERTFYLQALGPPEPVTFKCEKQQVSALADYLERIVAGIAVEPGGSSPPLPEPGVPIEPRFVLGTIGIGWDEATEQIVLELEEVRAGDDEDDDPTGEEALRDSVRVQLTRDTAVAFCTRARELVAAGRPTCRWCGRPVDRDGHLCPRMN